MQTVATLDRECLAHAKFTSAMDAIARSDTSGFLRSMRLNHRPADIGTWMSDIIQETALHFRLSEAALTGRDRAAAITRPRIPSGSDTLTMAAKALLTLSRSGSST